MLAIHDLKINALHVTGFSKKKKCINLHSQFPKFQMKEKIKTVAQTMESNYEITFYEKEYFVEIFNLISHFKFQTK